MYSHRRPRRWLNQRINFIINPASSSSRITTKRPTPRGKRIIGVLYRVCPGKFVPSPPGAIKYSRRSALASVRVAHHPPHRGWCADSIFAGGAAGGATALCCPAAACTAACACACALAVNAFACANICANAFGFHAAAPAACPGPTPTPTPAGCAAAAAFATPLIHANIRDGFMHAAIMFGMVGTGAAPRAACAAAAAAGGGVNAASCAANAVGSNPPSAGAGAGFAIRAAAAGFEAVCASPPPPDARPSAASVSAPSAAAAFPSSSAMSSSPNVLRPDVLGERSRGVCSPFAPRLGVPGVVSPSESDAAASRRPSTPPEFPDPVDSRRRA
mmetsp:Transcript_2788/g.9016  ORF Transcript_2788/g.9016 Transcript_2788/m.9016 type:complete len:331 (+) Transcript_2788:83-1075(+)|eukprot:31303-Pelagococcus_subviridis.AAC.12